MLNLFTIYFDKETKEEKIVELYEEYINLIYYIVSGFFNSQQDIEDVVYEILQKLIVKNWKKWYFYKCVNLHYLTQKQRSTMHTEVEHQDNKILSFAKFNKSFIVSHLSTKYLCQYEIFFCFIIPRKHTFFNRFFLYEM